MPQEIPVEEPKTPVAKASELGVPYKLDFLIALISLLFPFGWSVSGFPPNIVLACVCWAITLFTLLHFVWNWLRNTSRLKTVSRSALLAVPILIIVIAWKPVLDQYRIQHPHAPMPAIAIRTIPGLPAGVTNRHLRYQMLEIYNYSQTEITDFYGRLQLPQPIVTTITTDGPPGTVIDCQPILTRYSIVGTGNKSLLGPASARNYLYSARGFFPGNAAQLTGFSDGGDITGVWQITFDKLRPGSSISFSFLTSDDGDATNYIALANYKFTTNGATVTMTSQGTGDGGSILRNLTLAMIVHTNKVVKPNEDWHLGPNELRFYLEATFQYSVFGKDGNQHVLVPFVFNTNDEVVSSLPIQTEDGKWRRVTIAYQ